MQIRASLVPGGYNLPVRSPERQNWGNFTERVNTKNIPDKESSQTTNEIFFPELNIDPLDNFQQKTLKTEECSSQKSITTGEPIVKEKLDKATIKKSLFVDRGQQRNHSFNRKSILKMNDSLRKNKSLAESCRTINYNANTLYEELGDSNPYNNENQARDLLKQAKQISDQKYCDIANELTKTDYQLSIKEIYDKGIERINDGIAMKHSIYAHFNVGETEVEEYFRRASIQAHESTNNPMNKDYQKWVKYFKGAFKMNDDQLLKKVKHRNFYIGKEHMHREKSNNKSCTFRNC